MALPESIQEKVKEIELYGLKNHKFKVHVTSPDAVEVSIIFKDKLKRDESLVFNHN